MLDGNSGMAFQRNSGVVVQTEIFACYFQCRQTFGQRVTLSLTLPPWDVWAQTNCRFIRASNKYKASNVEQLERNIISKGMFYLIFLCKKSLLDLKMLYCIML